MAATCPYCGGEDLVVAFRDVRHKVDRSFGPFDLFACRDCGSLGTCTPPSAERLAAFYADYDALRPDWYAAAARDSALEPQYAFYARTIARRAAHERGRWIDIGAGHGEVATRLRDALPGWTGTAIDIGPRPARLAADVAYHERDLNRSDWTDGFAGRFDLVFSVAVWEHVLDPASFARDCLSLVAPGGRLVLVTPDSGSLAFRVLRRRWPYFEPGEHVSIPTRAGAIAALRRAATSLGYGEDALKLAARPLNVGYSVRYLLEVLRLSALGRLLPPNLAAPLPTGILIAEASRGAAREPVTRSE